MSVFGITGSLASGKSTVIKLLKKKGAIAFDADKTIHGYYNNKNSRVYKKIISLFPEVLRKGKICRARLGKIVFSSKASRDKLEKIVHPVIIKDLLQWIKKVRNKKGIFIAEVPLLFEKRLQRYFDGTILVWVKKDTLIKRILDKLGLSKSSAARRLSLYLPIKERIKKADYIINNSFNMRRLKKEIDLLWKKL